jgi:fatty acid-binding protein DegV
MKNRVVEAWQHLVDTGLAWQLQGWFGRRAKDLIEQGVIKAQEVQS